MYASLGAGLLISAFLVKKVSFGEGVGRMILKGATALSIPIVLVYGMNSAIA